MMATLRNLSPNQILALREIAAGRNISSTRWSLLHSMDLVDIDVTEDGEARDVLTPAGKALLAETDATPPVINAPANGNVDIQTWKHLGLWRYEVYVDGLLAIQGQGYHTQALAEVAAIENTETWSRTNTPPPDNVPAGDGAIESQVSTITWGEFINSVNPVYGAWVFDKCKVEFCEREIQHIYSDHSAKLAGQSRVQVMQPNDVLSVTWLHNSNDAEVKRLQAENTRLATELAAARAAAKAWKRFARFLREGIARYHALSKIREAQS